MISTKKKVLYGVFAAAFGLGCPILSQMTGMVIYQILLAVVGTSVQSITYLLELIDCLMYLTIGVLYFAIWKIAFRPQSELEKPSLKLSGRSIVIGAGIAGVIAVWMMIAEHIPALSASLQMMEKYNSMGISGGFLAVVLNPVILGPITEELAFRAIVFKGFQKAINTPVAAVLSALLFGIAHGILVQSVYTFIMGVIVALVYARTKNLFYPIIMHITINMLASMQLLIPGKEMILDYVLLFMIIPASFFLYKLFRDKQYQGAQC